MYPAGYRLGSSPSLKGVENSDARERSKKVRKYERKVGRDGLYGSREGTSDFRLQT